MGIKEGRQDRVDSLGVISTGSGGNSVSNDLHQNNTGQVATVSGAVTNLQGVHKGDGLQGGRAQERLVVESRGGGDTS